ncbi:MAG TPA: S24 family peptidase [Thermoanaerobaculia bacterium]|jgi:hypothetical protein
MTESWRDRLRAAIERSGRTPGEIAAEAEISPELLENILSGADADLETVATLAYAARVRVGWLLGEPPQPDAEPVLAEIPPVYADHGARLVYKACGDSMLHAGISAGDLLFVKPVEDLAAAAGRVVVCRVDGAEYVRRLDVDDDDIRLLGTDEMDAIDVAGRELTLVGIVIARSGAIG